MLRWAFKSLIAEPLSFLLTALVVGVALVLVIFFEAVFAGESENIIAYPKNINPDVWVMQRGIFNMHMATSFIWDWKRDRVSGIEGVEKVTPILYMNSIVEAGNKRWFSFVVGLVENDKRAGPWKMASGKPYPDDGEAVIPKILADKTGLKLGDVVRIANETFKVVGLSEDTFSMANSIAFITYSDLREIMSLIGSDSYLLVDAVPGTDPALLAERIRNEVEKINALPSNEFIKNDRELAMQMGVELIGIMTIIGAALAISLSMFMLYVFAARKRRDLAILKALGVSNGAVYISTIFQASCLAITGLVIALVLVYAAIPLTNSFAPEITLQITGSSLLRLSLVTILVAILASLIPVRQVMKIDPLLAFQR